MVVKIEEILPAGLELNEPLPLSKLDEVLAQFGDGHVFRASKDAPFHAHLQKVSGGVLLKGQLGVEVTSPCKRCLKESNLSLPVSFLLNLVPEAPKVAAAEEGEDDEVGERSGTFEFTDADQEVFNGKTIDLDPIVREQVLLALPLSVVCQDDCRGLCAVCGQNLNEKECGCERKIIDPRLMALKNIKLS